MYNVYEYVHVAHTSADADDILDLSAGDHTETFQNPPRTVSLTTRWGKYENNKMSITSNTVSLEE